TGSASMMSGFSFMSSLGFFVSATICLSSCSCSSASFSSWIAAIAAPLAAALAQKANFSRSVDPDFFLRALFMRTFEEKKGA
ncbi:MAG: hypothetical protein IIW01_09045, partial [Thermoguttaceae bacterium]|nr:hypothetical protein [Thermoguttaceae bacterium]